MAKQDTSKIIRALRELYEVGARGDHDSYKEFFGKAAQRQRSLWVTDIDSIRTMLVNQTRRNAIEVGRKMRSIGVAKFILGRRGATTRVEWLYRMDLVGQVAR